MPLVDLGRLRPVLMLCALPAGGAIAAPIPPVEGPDPSRAEEAEDAEANEAAEPPPTGDAHDPWPRGAWHLETAVGTDFPLDLGARIQVETPARIRLAVGVGFMPRAYQQATNAAIVAFGGYDESTAQIVEETLQSSLVITTALGVRPVPRAGFVVDVGYRLAALGGQATPEDLWVQASGAPIPTGPGLETGRAWTATSLLHMVHLRVGYEWSPVPHLFLRADLGGSFTVGAATRLRPTFEPRAPGLWEPFQVEAGAWLDDVHLTYAHTPSVGLTLGYRWF